MNRRGVIATIGTVSVGSIAGCSSNTDSIENENGGETESEESDTPPDHEYVPDPWENIEQDEGEASTTTTGQATLQEGQYALRQAQFNRQYNLEVSVTVQDGEIDVLGMSGDEFDRYRDRESPVYYDGFYETGVDEITILTQLGEGNHRVVFDNSAVFGSEPDGEVTFEFESVVSL